MNDDQGKGDAHSAARATRVVRIGVYSLLVLGLEWRLADPRLVASDPELWSMPWAMLFVMLPVSIAVWAYEATSGPQPGFKVDALWAVLVGTLSYVAMSLLG